ncbi:hypothetical protein ASF58_19045 [Methylobacterium sp. Leaf125]|nr:hypothetical protein ASF58_19045 [Methylobacterium sp. Leaf125]
MTWEALTEDIARRERGGWTRQSLAGNARISEAYDKRKRELGSGKAKVPRDPAIVILKRDIQERDVEIARLKDLLSAYEERFLVMLRNAAVRGLKPEELEKALPPIDRKSI